MGNNCCAGENTTQDQNNEFALKTKDSVQKESLHTQGNKSGVQGAQHNLISQDHLPLPTDPAYTIYKGTYPVQLTNTANNCLSSLPKFSLSPMPIPGQPIYPHSDHAYLITATNQIYKGQFFNRKPHGLGEMYTPTMMANDPNSGLETVKKGNTTANPGGLNNNQNATYTKNPANLETQSFIKYEGDFVLGKKEGMGRSIFPDGSVYSGDWFNDQPHGKGKLRSLPENNQEEMYDGEWKNGQMHGRGI